MRKLIFMVFIALGALIGLFTVVKGDWETQLVMMAFGALVGTAIGGALTRRGSRPLPRESSWLEQPHGQGTPEDELIRNYWRDRGYTPFSKPPEAVPDKHMFDPDRLG